MRCSKCSRIVKPVVAIDMDGTLGDYHGHFLRFAAEWTGQGTEALLRGSMSMYRGKQEFSEYCENLFGIDKQGYRAIKLAYRQGGMKRSMPILPGAKRICDLATKQGAELWITTTRPYLSLDTVFPDTVAWFDRHRIGFDSMIFDADKYAVLRDRVEYERVVAVIDDLGEMYDAAEIQFGAKVPILARGDYNTAVTKMNTMGLHEAGDVLKDRIVSWKERHDGNTH